METTDRPEVVTEEILLYLNDLRESGITNMFGAGIYLQDEFGLNRHEAKDALVYWMKNFKAGEN